MDFWRGFVETGGVSGVGGGGGDVGFSWFRVLEGGSQRYCKEGFIWGGLTFVNFGIADLSIFFIDFNILMVIILFMHFLLVFSN